jgi:hypothetical protein
VTAPNHTGMRGSSAAPPPSPRIESCAIGCYAISFSAIASASPATVTAMPAR